MFKDESLRDSSFEVTLYSAAFFSLIIVIYPQLKKCLILSNTDNESKFWVIVKVGRILIPHFDFLFLLIVTKKDPSLCVKPEI